MSLDLGGPALEVAIGLAFVFFLLSLIASAVTEAVAAALKWRAKTLEAGIRGMLGSTAAADTLIEHPLVQTDLATADKTKRKKPSYLSARNFALAFVDVLLDGKPANPDRPLKAVKKRVGEMEKAGGMGPESDLAGQLRPLLSEAGKDLGAFRASLERWFDDSMDRVSGWYKRKTLIVTIVAAAVIAVGLNVSAVRVAERLANDPTVRAAVVSKAEESLEQGGGTETAEKVEAEAEKEGKQGGAETVNGEKTQAAVKELDALELPILWSAANYPFSSWDSALVAVVGWLITALAVSLGAPFWFDALGKLAHLRAAGKKPARDETKQ